MDCGGGAGVGVFRLVQKVSEGQAEDAIMSVGWFWNGLFYYSKCHTQCNLKNQSNSSYVDEIRSPGGFKVKSHHLILSQEKKMNQRLSAMELLSPPGNWKTVDSRPQGDTVGYRFVLFGLFGWVRKILEAPQTT